MKWCDRPDNFIPFPYFGMCLDETDFKRALKKIGVEESVPFMQSSGAYATTYTFDFPEKTISIVCMNKNKWKGKGKSQAAIYGLIAHEATHIWQKVRDGLGESNPSSEFEAYSIQFICTQLFQAYADLK